VWPFFSFLDLMKKNMRLIKQKYPNFGEFIGISVCTNRTPGTTDTNPSPSAGPYSAEIKEIHNCTNINTQSS